MQTLRQEAIDVILKMEEPLDIDEIMYRLYVMDKIRKGRESAKKGELTSIADLKKEIEKW